MSKRSNVNPDHYKVAGRERPGDAVARSPKKPQTNDKAQERWKGRQNEQQERRGQ